MTIQEIRQKLENLVPVLKQAVDSCDSEEAFKDWGRDFINRVGAVCLPDDIVVIKNKNQLPQDKEESKDISSPEQKGFQMMSQFMNEVKMVKNIYQMKLEVAQAELKNIKQSKFLKTLAKETNLKTLMHLTDYNKRSLELEGKFNQSLEQFLNNSLRNWLKFEFTVEFKPYKNENDQNYTWPEVPSIYNPIVAVYYNEKIFQFELEDGQKSHLKSDLPLKQVKFGQQELKADYVDRLYIYTIDGALIGFAFNYKSNSNSKISVRAQNTADQSETYDSFNTDTQRVIGIRATLESDGSYTNFQFILATQIQN